MSNAIQYLRPSTVAEMLGIARQAAWQAMRDGRIESVEIDGKRHATAAAVEKYRRTRKPAPPRPVKSSPNLGKSS